MRLGAATSSRRSEVGAKEVKPATQPLPAKDGSWAAFIPSPAGGGLLGSGTGEEQGGPR